MRSTSSRIAVAVAALAVIVALFVVLNSGGDDNKDSSTSATTTTPSKTTGGSDVKQVSAPAQVVVRGGKPAGGIKKLTYTKGEQVRFIVNSDVADEIHVHGYDFHKDVSAGGSVSFSFPAKIEGVFVIELENHGEQIGELRVRPS